MNNQTNDVEKEYYWKKLCQFKFDLVYYGLHFTRCVNWIRWWKISIAVLTALSTGAWMTWNDVSWITIVCPIIIFVLQVISAGSELLPFDDRKIDLREMIDLLDPLYLSMEENWESIVAGKYTVEEIDAKCHDFQAKINDIKSRFLRNDSLPQLKDLLRKATTETNKYFESMR